MATSISVFASSDTLADVLQDLGNVGARRIRAVPPPGTATLLDVIPGEVLPGESCGRLPCELIDGTLVEKAMGYYESLLAMMLGRLIGDYAERHNLGIVLGEAGTLCILPGQVRVPDVSFLGWEKFPGRRLPADPIPKLVPDLAVEVLSDGNTDAEMRRKLDDYFRAGVRLVWYLDPRTRAMRIFDRPDAGVVVNGDGIVSGRDVLPGFEFVLSELFARAAGQLSRHDDGPPGSDP